MRGAILILAALLAASGCATTQVAFTATRQMGTQPDIYTDQTLENLARVADDATALPYFALLQNGVPTTNNTSTLTIGSMSFPTQTVVKQLHNQRSGTIGPIGGSWVVGANWTISPVNDPDRLTAMRYLYNWTLGRPPENLDKANMLLKQYLGKDFSLDTVHIPQDWFQHGGWHDVPKAACRKFHHHGTYYWIVPGMVEQLTQLTIKMLDIATVVPSNPSQTVVWKIDPKTNMPTDIQVTRTLGIVANEPTSVPLSPIAFPGLPIIHLPWAISYEHPTTKEIRTIPPPDDILTLPGRFNNYSSPLVSPGLFSQPPL